METHPLIDSRLESGTAAGQLAFWDGTQWVHTETNEFFWDDVNKRVGIKTATPSSELDVVGTVTMTRLLAGGVTK